MSYRREDIKNAIWDDEDFDGLTNEAALLYLWSFTNPRCGMAGVYRVKRRHICEGRFAGDTLNAVLAELQASRHLFYIDGYIWVRTRVKHLRTKGEPMLKSISKDVVSLPSEHPIRDAFCAEYEHQWADLVAAIRRGSGGVHIEPPETPPGTPRGVQPDGMESGFDRTPGEPPEGFRGCGRGNDPEAVAERTER